MSREMKADLSLLKELVSKLETQLEDSYLIRNDFLNDKSDFTYRKFVGELFKAAGLLMGISSESQLLITDLQSIVKYTAQPKQEDMSSLIDSVLSKYSSNDKN